MRSLLSLVLALLVAGSALLGSGVRTAYAAFHCMRIHAVMGGFSGDPKIQYVELRMTLGGQNLLTGHKIFFYDGSNTLQATFTFPAGVTGTTFTGDSILIATTEFNSAVTGGSADFTFSGNTTGGGDVDHPVGSPNGKVVFEPTPSPNCGNPTAEVDSVAYGTGTPNFGSAAAALPSPSDNRALRLDALTYPPTDASVHNALAAVSASTFSVTSGNLSTDLTTPRNHARTVLRLNVPAVGGVAEEPALPSPNAASGATAGGGDRASAMSAAAAGIAAAIAGVAVWYVYRRRTTR